jgi:hypothetical protein
LSDERGGKIETRNPNVETNPKPETRNCARESGRGRGGAPAKRCRFNESVFENPFPGSTGYQPDGMEGTVRANGDGLSVETRSAVPSGRLPDGAGKLPALPFFQADSKR